MSTKNIDFTAGHVEPGWQRFHQGTIGFTFESRSSNPLTSLLVEADSEINVTVTLQLNGEILSSGDGGPCSLL